MLGNYTKESKLKAFNDLQIYDKLDSAKQLKFVLGWEENILGKENAGNQVFECFLFNSLPNDNILD